MARGYSTWVFLSALGANLSCDTVKDLIEQGEKALPGSAASVASTEPAPPASAAPMASAETAEPAVEVKPVNEAFVKRFDDEKKLEPSEDLDGKLADKLTKVQTEPDSGDVVAALKEDTEIQRVAARGDFSLVTFENPEKAGEHLMGWVLTRAMAQPPIECGPGLAAAFIDGLQRCVILCESNDDCPRTDSCTGSGAKAVEGKPGDAVKVCASRAGGGVSSMTPESDKADTSSKSLSEKDATKKSDDKQDSAKKADDKPSSATKADKTTASKKDSTPSADAESTKKEAAKKAATKKSDDKKP